MSITRLWGPESLADAPRSLVVRGALTGSLGAGIVVAAAVGGVFTGHRMPGSWSGVAVTLALAAYLLRLKSGAILVGAVAVLGVALAFWVPLITDEAVLTVRGESRTVIVTEVHERFYESRNYSTYSCSVALPDGTPVSVEVAKSCDASTMVGDQITMIFDPEGKADPTDRPLTGSIVDSAVLATGSALTLAVTTCIAIIRSERGRR